MLSRSNLPLFHPVRTWLAEKYKNGHHGIKAETLAQISKGCGNQTFRVFVEHKISFRISNWIDFLNNSCKYINSIEYFLIKLKYLGRNRRFIH